MSEVLREQLSAFLDGELGAAEADLLVRRLGTDSDLRNLAAHYYLIGSTLRGERVAGTEFGQRVTSAIDQEPDVTGAPISRTPVISRGRLLKTAAGGAIAATVAVVALLGIQRQTGIDDNNSPAARVADMSVTAPSANRAATYTVPALSPSAGPVVINETRLVNYLLRHGRVAPAVGSNDMNARIISVGIAPGQALDEEGDDTGPDTRDDIRER